jgi:hypothetical protein
LKRTILPLIAGCIFLGSCEKESLPVAPEVKEPCELQTANPTGRSYSSDSIVPYICTSKYCGFLPLSTKNYWVYEDSIFNNGVFVKVQLDTLQFTTTSRSLSDNLIWWQSNMEIGLPEMLNTNDSTIFSLAQRNFDPAITDARKDYGLFAGDSLRYLGGFDDIAAHCRSLKISNGALKIPAGNFTNYLYFEKNARYYQRDQVYILPGTGVLKYIQEKSQFGSPQIKLQKISTLVSFHIE